ncbi:hypothetical protein AB835_11430 [Candidatus Endobugula sertula]|uniref:Uncharacterized protein n=1 Tax=Candidatus Endobugula sertula TaxID=62101 RepID=A0A1D2QN05_9GAMM|nr:hypothetical protein AB835_11430 [Candidatus Endobugula sertula]
MIFIQCANGGKKYPLYCVVIISLFFSSVSFDASARKFYFELGNEDKGIFTQTSKEIFGNDNSDGNFSQGLYFSYTSNYHENGKLEYSLEQDVYTPSFDNKSAPTAVIGDRPYAAFLGLGANYIRKSGDKNILHRSADFIQQFNIKIGVVGHDAGGQELQDFAHRIRGATEYTGWSDQVENKYGGFFDLSCSPQSSFWL